MKIFILFFFIIISTPLFGQRKMASLLNQGVLINIGNSSGSGFILKRNNDLFLVTAKHVVVDPETNMFYGPKIEFITYAGEYESTLDSTDSNSSTIDVKMMRQSDAFQLTPDRDVIVIRIGKITGPSIQYYSFIASPKAGKGVSIIGSTQCSYFKDINIGYDIYTVGFPTSLDGSKYFGMSQFNFKTPLMRKGIVAGKNFDRKLVVLDCAVYNGSSGGPVFQADLLAPATLIGIIIEYIPRIDEWKNTQSSLSHIYTENSGYSLMEPVDEIFKIISLFKN